MSTEPELPPNLRPGGRQLPPLEEREWKLTRWATSKQGVFSITLDRPERLNALDFPLLHELQQLIDHARRPEIRVVTLRGVGSDAFCSGDDLKGMGGDPERDRSETVHHRLLLAIRELPKPVVALVCGWALGHGFELASACDLRLCADNLEAGDHRVTRALGMNGGTSWFVPRIIGRGRALELLLTGRHMNAREALEWGWATRTWPLAEFDKGAAEYVDMLARLPTIAVGAFKDALEYSAEHSLRDSLAHELEASSRNRGTEDAREGLLSWDEKRTPVFHGR